MSVAEEQISVYKAKLQVAREALDFCDSYLGHEHPPEMRRRVREALRILDSDTAPIPDPITALTQMLRDKGHPEMAERLREMLSKETR